MTSGIFRWTRNPMYLASHSLLLGWAAYARAPAGAARRPAFVAWMNRWQIPPEERALAQLFGDEFARYRTRVRRWL